MSKSISSTRNESIDLIKIVAMTLVVALHSLVQFLHTDYPTIPFILYNLGVVAIPLFFMVSGFLLIGRVEVSYGYSLRKIFNILRFVFIFVALNWMVFYLLNWWNFTDLLTNFVSAFVQDGFFWFLWYLGTMMIIYLLYPLLNRLHTSRKAYILTLIAMLVTQNYAFISNIICMGETNVCQTFRLWNWVTYFMLGGLVKNFSLSTRLTGALTAVLTAAALLTMYWLYPYIHGYTCEYFYSSPIVVALTVSIFMFIKSLHIRGNKFIKECAALFLPVYTLHPILIDLPYKYTYAYIDWLGNFWFGSIACFLSVLLTTVLISYIIMKIPYVDRLFRL